MTGVVAPAETSIAWSLRFDERPWTSNTQRRWHHHRRADAVRRWRQAFALLAREQRIPLLDAIEITATPYLANRRGQQDVGGCYPAAKAAIDGLADAGVVPDDGPDHVRSLTFTAPVFGQGDALVLIVTEAR